MPLRPILNLLDGEHPCDFNQDVMPAIRDVVARGSPKNMTHLGYFAKVAIGYRDARLAGNPKPEKANDRRNHKSSTSDKITANRDARRAIRGEVLAELKADRMAS